MPVVVIAPDNAVVPPPPTLRLPKPLIKAGLIVVAPEKSKVRSLPAPVIVEPNVGVVPVKMALPPSVTAPL